jgi:hypothetical protein
MLRFVARFVGFWLVAAAMIAAVVDGAKSIAGSAFVLTPLTETLTALAAIGAEAPAEFVPPTLPWPGDAALAWLMAAPTVAVLAVPGVLLLLLGARRRRPFLSREFAA